MKQIFLAFLFLTFLCACETELKKSVENYPDGKILKISYIDTTLGKSDTIRKVEYWPNGNKRIEGSYKNNKREGDWTYWYEKGIVWSKGSFKDGLSNGKFDIYKEDGSRYMQSSYTNGIPDGCWTFFDKNKKIKEVYFDNDSIVKQISY